MPKQVTTFKMSRAKRPLSCKFKAGPSDKKEGVSHRRDPFERKIRRVCYT